MHQPNFTCAELFETITRNPDPSSEIAERECTLQQVFAENKRNNIQPDFRVLEDTLELFGAGATIDVEETFIGGHSAVSTIDLAIEDGLWKVQPRRL